MKRKFLNLSRRYQVTLQILQVLRLRTKELSKTNHRLKREITHRKTVEVALEKSKQHYAQLLEKSNQMQKQLRHLSRRILLVQEEERKEISRKLHDEIAQTLAGINVHLASLTKEATVNTKELKRKIIRTQRLVEKSVNMVHKFARKLRPTLLDDLGLIPALQSFMKDFIKNTGIPIHFKAFAGVEQLNNVKRTVLYRVAQAALTNVFQHAHATQITVDIRKFQKNIWMEINDNGKSFQVDRVLYSKNNKRLGILGMRERVEMVGGSFRVESAPGKGTTIYSQIPLGNGNIRQNLDP